MGFFGGQRQRALAQFNNPRDPSGDGLALAGNFSPDAATVSQMPPGYMGGQGIGDGMIERQMGFPPMGDLGVDETRRKRQMPLSPATVGNRSGIIGRSANPPTMFQMPNVDGSPMVFDGVQPSKPQGKGGFFRKNGPWVDVLGAIGDSLSGNPIYQNAKMQRMQLEQQHAKSLQDRQWQVEDRNFKASQPEYFTSGRNRVKFNPMTGESQVVYNGPEDFDEYATALGMEPGSDEYEQAVTDYVLRGHGPTALGYDKQLDDYRTANDKGYDDYRTRNRQKVRSMPSYRDKNPLPVRPRQAAAPAVTAHNSKGEVVTLNSRGQWVDASGNPVK